MYTKKLEECDEFTAGDGTRLREILHPAKEALDIRYSLAHAVLKAGQVSRPHRLKTSEVYYIIRGKGVMHINNETSPVGKGQTVYIPSLATQYLENTGTEDFEFLCIVDPAWLKEDEEIL
jgi:mannose-6-phosphate isomerase-like protein (cupin superfamily)